MWSWWLLTCLLPTAMAVNFTLPLRSGQIGNQMFIVDSSGKRVKMACVNWYGAHMENLVVNGLDTQPMASIAAKISELGFNCVRLPFALDTFFLDPVIPEAVLAANPELIGQTAMQIFDATVQALTDLGLIVILNNHVSTAMWCCSAEDGEGLWYTNEYPEDMWEECLVSLVSRYKENQLVAGMDLRNEVRMANGVFASWGNGKRNDWALAAEKLGNLILDVNPDLLIIVEGILSGGNLIGALTRPVILDQMSQLVYSGHIYPFSPVISDLDYDLFKITMHAMQTFVADAGHNYSAPYWMGEFGTGEDSDNWRKIVRFLQETDHDWAYWSIDGYKYPGEGEGYGILNEDYNSIRHEWKLEQLQSIMPPLTDPY